MRLPGLADHMALLLPQPHPYLHPTLGCRARPASRSLSPSLEELLPWTPFLACGGVAGTVGSRGQSFTHQKLLVLSPERGEQKPGPEQVGRCQLCVTSSVSRLFPPRSGLWNQSMALGCFYPPASALAHVLVFVKALC